MDIYIEEVLNITVIDEIAVSIMGNGVSGASVSDNTRIHLLDDSQVNQNIAQSILDNYGNLAVTADKIIMVEGDANPVITCEDALILNDSTVNYVVLFDGRKDAAGTDTVESGAVTLNLIDPDAGVYEIFIYRNAGNFASGSVTITVNEAE